MLIAPTLSIRFSSGGMNALAPTKSGNLFKNLFRIRVLLVATGTTFQIINRQTHVFARFFLSRKISIHASFYSILFNTEISNKIKLVRSRRHFDQSYSRKKLSKLLEYVTKRRSLFSLSFSLVNLSSITTKDHHPHCFVINFFREKKTIAQHPLSFFNHTSCWEGSQDVSALFFLSRTLLRTILSFARVHKRDDAYR